MAQNLQVDLTITYYKNTFKIHIAMQKEILGLQQKTFSPSSKNSCIQTMKYSFVNGKQCCRCNTENKNTC